ncbi:MAG TPA: HAMP domain-containing protein [Bacteroidetes bacterium]|nr:HAMP domain-containing protein [Bacteroidota bacterium]
MKLKLTLQQKIFFLVIGVSIVIYAIAIGYIATRAKKTAMHDAIMLTVTTAQKNASDIKALLEEDLVAMRTLSQSVLSYREMSEAQWKKVFAKMYEEVLQGNPQFLSVWDSWELSHIDSNYTKDFGRYVAEYWREGHQIKSNFSLKSMTGDNAEYARLKRNATEALENPYFYSYTGSGGSQILMTSIISPIIEGQKFIGVVGADISLDRYHPIITQIKPFKNSYAFLVANDLQYTAHPDKEKQGQYLIDDYEELISKYAVAEKIKNGEDISFVAEDLNGTKSQFIFSPIIVGKTGTPWSLAIVVPHSTVLAEANQNFTISIIVGIIGLIILSLAIVYSSKSITNPILRITNILKRIARGNISSDMKLRIETEDEIGEMANALNTTIDGLNQKVEFASSIERGNLESELQVLSSDDILGNALIDMHNSLRHASEEEEKRKEEDNRSRWANEGLAKFGEILRQNNDNMDVLAKSIIKELIQTLDANQGGLFLLNEDDELDPHFELTSAYAYSRYKYKSKKILMGEGLIGACAMEKKTMHLTEIPDGYIEITSGLGQSNPTTLLLVPLVMDDKVFGVIEIASFNIFQPYQIEFIEKLAESIASTIATVKVNIKTSHLLTETQQQAEEMAAQEEEMRQNMEELQATQEESSRKAAEMQSLIDALNNSSFVIEYDPLGYITAINDAYLELLSLSRDEVVGTHHSDKMELSTSKKKEYDQMWANLRNGIPQKQVNKFVVHNKTFVFQETYTPIKNEMGEIYKILKISNNITNLVKN